MNAEIFPQYNFYIFNMFLEWDLLFLMVMGDVCDKLGYRWVSARKT